MNLLIRSESKSLCGPLQSNVCERSYHRVSSLWQWSDNTTALSYCIQYVRRISPPYCAALRFGMYLHVIQCDDPQDANFLCEIPTDTDQQSQSDVILPDPANPASSLPGMVECHHREATRQFLGCDVSSGGRDSPDTPPCPHDRRDLDSLWFQCRDNSGCVPYTLVCDHRQDCADGCDEDFCSFEECSSTECECREGNQVSADNVTHASINQTLVCASG